MTKILNTRILLSGATILAAAAVIIGATFAFFSDVETSEANAFTAGDVQVAIGSLTHTYNGVEGDEPTFTPVGFSFALTDLKPLDDGSVSYVLSNEANDATVCAMVEESGNTENGRNDSEIDAGDANGGNPGPGEGELQNFMSFNFGGDSGLLSEIDGEWFEVGDVPSGGSDDFAIGYCFGEYSGVDCVANSTGEVNTAQTDGMTADISFYAVQTRNNPDFDCASLNEQEPLAVSEEDLETVSLLDAKAEGSWFFYNDTNDTIMTIDQFGGDGGENHMDEVAGTDGAKMLLHDALSRYNIATYKYSDVKLADINQLSYRIYDGSASSETPYLHFNVDFNNSDTWQNRLVMVPSGVTAETWTTVDALDGGSAMWTYSGANWPVGLVDPSEPGTNPRTWDEILANYPDAETRSTDSFLGVRVGHPGPDGEIGYVDWINFNGEVSDFVN